MTMWKSKHFEWRLGVVICFRVKANNHLSHMLQNLMLIVSNFESYNEGRCVERIWCINDMYG